MNFQLKIDLRYQFLAATVFGLCAVQAAAQYMGPAVSSPPVSAGASDSAANAEYKNMKIEPGDVISISTYGAPELTTISQTSSGSIASGTGP
jgi:protein involved in polysaccharide export with SLBB domain